MRCLLFCRFFWDIELERGWSTVLAASDASTNFGFGLCAAKVTASLSRRIGRAADRGQHHIRLRQFGSQGVKRKARKGSELHLPLTKKDFKHILSARAKFSDNIVALEGDASLLLVRWLCRSAGNHRRRTPVLIDAQSVLGALVRGRSSAPSLKITVRRIAAHLLASDISLKPIYTPSEENPADEGSRGVAGP